MDVYLAGFADVNWRNEFKNAIARDISVFDPYDKNYEEFDEHEKANHIAKELETMDESELVIFCFCPQWDSLYSSIQLGEAMGKNLQVILYLQNPGDWSKKIQRYCEYRGIMIIEDMEDLVENVEEILAQSDLVESMDFQ